jgi:hypothetical protein
VFIGSDSLLALKLLALVSNFPCFWFRFGNDKSIVRVRNFTLYELHRKLTKGIRFIDWKTKWNDYDLRISISAPKHLQDLADDIESATYSRGYRNELEEDLKRLDPEAIPSWNIEKLKQQIEYLEEQNENNTTRVY